MRPSSSAPFRLSAEAGADFWLQIGGEVALDDGRVLAFTELLSKVGDRVGAFVRLNDRQFLRLTQSLLRQMEVLARVGETSKQTLSVPPSAVALLDALSSGKEMIDFPALVRDRIADFRRAFKAVTPVPASLTCELRSYQRDGFVWLNRLAACGLGACLADDMGLGKTVQILALLTVRASEGPSLVIAPTSVIRNWADEAARFAPALRLVQLAEAEDRGSLLAGAGAFDVVVCSYGLLPFAEELLAGRPWNVVVLDEAQAVKNRLARRAKIVKRFQGRARVIATGTPVENNLTELWSLFDFLNPGLLGTHGQFERRFCNGDGTVSPLLKRMTAPFLLRRLKSAVLDELPPKTEITLSVTLDVDERALYESCRREALAALEGAAGENNRITILAHLTKLRRACCHPSLVMPGCGMPGQKVEALLELVEDLRANGHRALVFSQFVDFLTIIRTRLDAAKVGYQYLDGSTPEARRADAVSRFQRGEGDLFLISLKAGGTGLNLTAANYVVLLDPWWNPAVETQAADRAHRIGQRNPVTVYRLVTADTVEERVVALHAKKLALAESLLDDTADTRLSANDLLSLFKA
jgi:SNF2 family DNA or RNA helicase